MNAYTSTMLRVIAVLLVSLMVTMALGQGVDRDRSLPYKFRKLNPCPANGKLYGACPGWEIDHKESLRCGGPDTLENLQWIRKAEHKKKTKEEAARCGNRKKGERLRQQRAK